MVALGRHFLMAIYKKLQFRYQLERFFVQFAMGTLTRFLKDKTYNSIVLFFFLIFRVENKGRNSSQIKTRTSTSSGPGATKTCPASMFDTRHFSLYSVLYKKEEVKAKTLGDHYILGCYNGGLVTNHLQVKTLIRLGDLWVEFNDIRGQSTSFFHRLGGMC